MYIKKIQSLCNKKCSYSHIVIAYCYYHSTTATLLNLWTHLLSSSPSSLSYISSFWKEFGGDQQALDSFDGFGGREGSRCKSRGYPILNFRKRTETLESGSKVDRDHKTWRWRKVLCKFRHCALGSVWISVTKRVPLSVSLRCLLSVSLCYPLSVGWWKQKYLSIYLNLFCKR